MAGPLRDHRNRRISPYLLLTGLVNHLETCAQLFTAIGHGGEPADPKWLEVADALRAAATTLRRVAM